MPTLNFSVMIRFVSLIPNIWTIKKYTNNNQNRGDHTISLGKNITVRA